MAFRRFIDRDGVHIVGRRIGDENWFGRRLREQLAALPRAIVSYRRIA